jgi:predicted RNA-binding Zn-ribbon protein involved in translation (DUF1610 family)
MPEDAYWIDGNGVAGLLAEVFEAEMTTVERVCQSCGRRNAVGAHLAYLAAGTVLRCPSCGDMAACIATLPDRHVVQLAGSWLMQFPRGAPRAAVRSGR